MINTPSTIGNAHKQKILTLLRQEGKSSRAEIARHLHLSPPAVTGNIAPLLENGMLAETGVGSAELGRKPVMLEINPDFCDVIGIDIRERIIRVAAADFAGNIHTVKELARKTEDKADKLLQTIFESVDQLFTSNRNRIIAAIAVSVPGIVEQDSGKILLSTITDGWGEMNLKRELEQRYNVLVAIENDVNMAICGEAGLGSNDLDMIYIKVSASVFF